MSIRFEIDTNIIVFSFFVQIFDTSGSENGIHVESLFQIFRTRVIGVVGLDKSNFRIKGNIEKQLSCIVQFLSLLSEFSWYSVKELSQNSARSITIDKIELAVGFSTI